LTAYKQVSGAIATETNPLARQDRTGGGAPTMDREKDARNQSLYPVYSQVQKGGCYEVLAPGMDGKLLTSLQ